MGMMKNLAIKAKEAKRNKIKHKTTGQCIGKTNQQSKSKIGLETLTPQAERFCKKHTTLLSKRTRKPTRYKLFMKRRKINRQRDLIYASSPYTHGYHSFRKIYLDWNRETKKIKHLIQTAHPVYKTNPDNSSE
jgi:hypothetical protein